MPTSARQYFPWGDRCRESRHLSFRSISRAAARPASGAGYLWQHRQKPYDDAHGTITSLIAELCGLAMLPMYPPLGISAWIDELDRNNIAFWCVEKERYTQDAGTYATEDEKTRTAVDQCYLRNSGAHQCPDHRERSNSLCQFCKRTECTHRRLQPNAGRLRKGRKMQKTINKLTNKRVDKKFNNTTVQQPHLKYNGWEKVLYYIVRVIYSLWGFFAQSGTTATGTWHSPAVRWPLAVLLVLCGLCYFYCPGNRASSITAAVVSKGYFNGRAAFYSLQQFDIRYHRQDNKHWVGAFRGCNSLASITIPSSVISIGFDAFEYWQQFDFGYHPRRGK